MFVVAKDWKSDFIAPESDWMKKYLEIESNNLDTQLSPASDVLHAENFNVMVSSAK